MLGVILSALLSQRTLHNERATWPNEVICAISPAETLIPGVKRSNTAANLINSLYFCALVAMPLLARTRPQARAHAISGKTEAILSSNTIAIHLQFVQCDIRQLARIPVPVESRQLRRPHPTQTVLHNIAVCRPSDYPTASMPRKRPIHSSACRLSSRGRRVCRRAPHPPGMSGTPRALSVCPV